MIDALPTLIDSAADRDGDHPALTRLDATLGYAELVARSTRVAQSLRAIGVRRGDRVGLYQHQTVDALVALHGIQRAGAAYVPIDPQQPPARVAAILERCDVRVLISDGLPPALLETALTHSHRVGVVVGSAVRTDGIEALSWKSVAAGLADGRLPTIGADDLAYVIFTSGSTGDPKGIVHTHRSALAYAGAAAKLYDLAPADRIAGIAPLHFDQSTFHLFAAPLAGATACIVPEAHARLPASLGQRLQTDRVSVIYTVPFLLIQLLLRGGLDQLRLDAVRWVLFGGEPFPTGHLRALMQYLPGASFSNVYGPAEVNQCTYFNLPRAPGQRAGAVPVGDTWPAAEALVVRADQTPADPDEAGELWVSSDTMMDRYWGGSGDDPRVFAFRTDGAGRSVRYYRTGDRFRRDGQGCLWYLGRLDRQVKVRGQRLDLDEVESVLYGHAGVAEAAAYLLARDDATSVVEAAVIPKPGVSLSERELRRFAAAKLPAAAVPEHFEIRAEFPRTGSDKIDRRALALARAVE